jgi:hypothetical protein
MSLEDLLRQWPRPRVGERVRLSDGTVVEVIAVRGAKTRLKLMTEPEAMRFGPDTQASYGPHWMSIYYQADVLIGGALRHIEPKDVEEVLPPS